MFALILLPILAAVGYAVDTSRQVTLKKHLQAAADSAALAGARTYSHSFLNSDAANSANAAFDLNIAGKHGDATCRLHSMAFDEAAFAVKVFGRCRVPTMLGLVISGRRNVRVNVESTAAAIYRTADVAMMFDLSRSMDASEIRSLKRAGKRAAELIIGLQPGATGRIAVVPFAGGVNAVDFGNLATGRASDTDDEGDGDRVCVTERTGTDAFTDADPTSSPVGGVISPTTVFSTSEYDVVSTHQCPDSPVAPLNGNLRAVKRAIDNLSRSSGVAGGKTAGHLGIAWTWYTLSPNWNSVWQNTGFGGHSARGALPYGDPNILKIAILMTDGTFDQAYAIGVADSDDATERANIRTAAQNLCAGMRDSGILIYAIAYNATSEAESLLQDCVGHNPDLYFETDDDDELEGIYEEIAGKFITVGIVE